jgi:chromosome segregation protein
LSGHRVTFKRLIIEGFGLYRERTEFNFSEGISCCVANNENGKSTMVAGLLATFFGLLHRQRASSSFTLERFRNWDNPSSCRGEVFFAAGDQHYQVVRDFDTHRVELWLIADDFTRTELLVEGTHNPAATRRLKAYEEKLQELLGINSRELFSATFCVEQPLPEPKNISAELQGLLSGGKGTPFHDALKRLENSLKKLTRFTGPNDRGITARNMNKDGLLEQIENRITELGQRIEDGKRVADSVEEVREQLVCTEEEYNRKIKELKRKEKTRQAWSNWRLLQNEYFNAARERDKLKQTEAELRKLQEKLQLLEKELEQDYPEFKGFSPKAGEALEKLIWLDRQLEENDETIRKLKESVEADDEKLARLKTEENNKYAGWDWLGADPVTRLKTIYRNAETCKKEWQQFRQDVAELEEINNELEKRFIPFENASEEILELARHYDRYHAELNNAAAKAKEAFENADEQKGRYLEAKSEFESKYIDLLELPENIEEVVNEKLSAAKKIKELEESEKVLSRKLAVPAGLRVAGMALLGGLAGVILSMLGGGSIPVLVAIIIMAALAGYWAGGYIYSLINANNRRDLALSREELRRCKEGILELDNKLGPFASADEAELGRLVQRLYQYAEERCRLEEEGRKISEDELQRLLLEWKKAMEEKDQFDRAMGCLTGVYDDVSTALGQWRSILERKKKLDADLYSRASEIWGCTAEAAAGVDPFFADVAEHWKEVARFLQVVVGGSAVQNVAGMMEQLGNLHEEWWQQQKEKAARLAEIKKVTGELEYQLNSNNAQLVKMQEKRENLLGQKRQVDDDIREIVRKKYGGNAAVALERWKKRQQIINIKEAVGLQLATILQNNGVEDVDALQSVFSKKEDDVTVRLLRWKEHIDRNPGLPGTEQADDLEQINNFLEALEREILELDAEKNKLEQSRSELLRKQASLEGGSPLNIAAAEIELFELEQQKERMLIEADALEMAHKELEEAISEYRKTYKERLEKHASHYCQAISNVPERYVEFDENFNISVREGGRLCPVEYLSKGGRDQLYLALRFAVADLLAEEVKLPLIFDDSFTSTDANRKDNIRRILQQQAIERQFIIMAHEDAYSNWGQPVEIKSLV